MYAWEKPFQLVVKAARAYEMSALRKSIFIRSMFLGFMLFTERSVMFLTVLTLALTGNMISATLVSHWHYTSVALRKCWYFFNRVFLFTDLSHPTVLRYYHNERYPHFTDGVCKFL